MARPYCQIKSKLLHLKSLTHLSFSRFNTVTTVAVFILLSLHALFVQDDFRDLATIVRAVAEIGLSFGSSILGFLIAGFTIFATLTKPSLFIMMYQNKHQGSKLNYLKHNFFAFVEVFVVYLAFLGGCLLIAIFGAPNGAAVHFLNFLADIGIAEIGLIKEGAVKVTYVVMCTLLYYSLMSLKSFIYNIYHIVITSIVWEMNSPPKE